MRLTTKFEDYNNQVPRVYHGPEYDSILTTGPRVIRLAEMAGLVLDEWEKFAINASHAIDPETQKLLSAQVAIIVSRQNGKGSILEAVELGWLFLSFEKLVLHSAHQFKTCADSYARLKILIAGIPELEAMCHFNNSHGHEGIKVTDPDTGKHSEIKFIARGGGGGSGRGFPATKVVLDEAYDLTVTAVQDVTPTVVAAFNGQTWFTSSPVNEDFHKNGVALAKIRARAIANIKAGTRFPGGLCYMEWSCPENLSKLEFHKPKWWKVANPAYEIRSLDHSALQSQFELLPLESFGCEHLGVGKWPNPESENKVISQEEWNALLDPGSKIVGARVFAIDVAPYGLKTSISVAGLNISGAWHVEVIKSARGTDWVIDYLVSLCTKWRPLTTFYDARTHASALVDGMTLAKIPIEEMKGLAVSQAFAMFYDKCVLEKVVRHPEQPSINEALLGAKTRSIGDGLAWDKRDAKIDITGLVSMTNALYGFSLKTSGMVDVAGSCW